MLNQAEDKYAPLFTIGVVAKMAGISVQSLRLYEKEGLLMPHKTDTGRRMFSRHDLERIACIRKMIVQQGLNFNGIRKIFSLIPCWEFKGGLDSQCRACPAYYKADTPCWSTPDVGQKCKVSDCRECKVYRLEFSCEKLKTLFYGNEYPDDVESKTP